MWFALAVTCTLVTASIAPPGAEVALPPPLVLPANNVEDSLGPASPASRTLLMRHLQGTYYGWLLDGNRVRLTGWTEAAFTASTDQIEQLPMVFNYRANQLLLQQNWLRIDRATDPNATEPTVGFRVDTILPGSDYRFTVDRGLFDGQLTANNGQPNLYGFDPVQFYVETHIPQVAQGLSIKVGRFFAQFGFESIDTTQNPFLSRAYTFIYNPFTQTGVLTQVQLDEAWSMQNGLVLGSDVFIDPAATPTYIGSIKWAPPRGRTSVLCAVVLSDPRYDTRQEFNRPQIFDVVFSYKIDTRTTYTLDALYGYQRDVPQLGFADWFGLVQYINHQIGPRVAGNVRLEWFNDPSGQRTGSEGLYTALTAGLAYQPCPELLLRPEVRYDYNDQTRPFEGKKGLVTAALDLVLRW